MYYIIKNLIASYEVYRVRSKSPPPYRRFEYSDPGILKLPNTIYNINKINELSIEHTKKYIHVQNNIEMTNIKIKPYIRYITDLFINEIPLNIISKIISFC